MCCRCPSGAGRTLQAVPQTGTFILAARGSGHAAGPRGAISVSHRKSEGGEPHEAAAAAFHRGDLDLRESRSGEDGGRGGSKPQAQTGPRTELDVLYKLSHRRRRRSRRRGKRRRRRTRGTGGGGGGGGGGERRKRGSFRQTQRTKSGRLRRCRPGASPILCPAPDADFTPVASDNTKALLSWRCTHSTAGPGWQHPCRGSQRRWREVCSSTR
ncbi:cerebral cavernous malformations 2 protein-like isoform X1 [Etheostoma spectabile]|uniref:cerebral cavernous malformations 2 protein-like isoform X1 n=1 Tax=Etheostoma spectabile TaxID=54343 RepID=UPI0013AFAFEE|nr:cerebral cavernous malformations 2 protein-like isoform X1 [Etheostoma spectabile]